MSTSDKILSLDTERGLEMPRTPTSPVRWSTSAENEKPSLDATSSIDDPPLPDNRFLQWARKIEHRLGFEARGIRRVQANEQSAETTLSFMQIVVLWFSINTASQNITLASIGQEVFGLGFKDAVLCSVLGALVGIVPVAYTATWGPWSGNRTMICARFVMGWWPVKLCVLLNLVLLIGYTMIDAVVAGQILSAVSPNGSLSVEVGIIIAAILTFLITTFGIKIFHHYEQYAWIPQTIVLLLLAGTAGPYFDITTPSVGSHTTILANRLSFFSLCLSSSITYAPIAADFTVYCSPLHTSRAKVFFATLLGLALSFTLTFTLGCGLASSLSSPSNPISSFPSAPSPPSGSGALVVAGFAPLGVFGKFCSVVAALGLISNMCPTIYSSGIDFQILGRYTAVIPRFVWNSVAVVIFMVCGLAGRDHLAAIFTNFLALMGYWVVLWVVVTLEEEFVFRRLLKRRRKGKGGETFVWSDWDKKDRLPIGVAAMVAFCVGWVGAVLCMKQAYFVGPIARLVGGEGADMGNFVGFVMAGCVYVPVRWWEVRRFGR